MKRIFSILLVLLLSLSVLTGCAQVEELVGKLPFDIPFLSEKECTHDYEVVVTEPTCTEAGFTTKTCKLCQNVETVEPTEALGHNYADGACTVCKAEDPNYVPPHEHNFVEGKCECGVEDPNYVPPHVHAYETVVTAPTCTEDGFTTYTCACGESYVADEVDALGHNYVEHVCAGCGIDDPEHYFEMSLTEALAAADGKKVSVSGTVSVAGSWNANFSNMNATIVDADGNELYLYRLSTEVKLGDIITVSGVMATYNGNRQMAQGATAVITGHDSSYDVVNEYTIPEALELPDNTNIIVIGTVVEINGEWSDNYGNMNVTIADEEGNTLYVYRLATKVALNDIIKIKGAMGTYKEARQVAEGATAEIIGTAPSCEHVWESAVTAPTCTEEGYTTYTCSECGESYVADEKVAATGHTTAVDAAVAATCTSTGLTEGSHCSVCNEVLVAQTEVAALGHTTAVDAAVAATCTSTGLTEGSHCSVCNEVLVAQVETAIVDHSYVSGVCVCGKVDENYATYDNPAAVQPGDYTAPNVDGEIYFYQMVNLKNNGYYYISTVSGENSLLKIGTDIYGLRDNGGLNDSMNIYVLKGTTCYFAVPAGLEFRIEFVPFNSDPVDNFVGVWKGDISNRWGTISYVVKIDENGLGTIVEKVPNGESTYTISYIVVNAENVLINAMNAYEAVLEFNFTYDPIADTLTGGVEGGNAVFVRSTDDEPDVNPDVTYETVIVFGNNIIYFSADEIAANLANRQVIISEFGNYSFSSRDLFISKLIATDGTEYYATSGFYLDLPAGEYTAVFTMFSNFGLMADTAYPLELKVTSDIGGGEGGEGGEGGDDDGEGEYIDPYDTLKDSLYGFYTVDGYELFLFYNGFVGIYYVNVYGDNFDLYFTYEVTEIEEGVYALTLTLADHDNNYGLENVDAILNCEFVIGGESEDDTPDFITDLMESISGSYEFDDYCVFIYPDYDREMYIANVYGDGFDLYFTFEAVDLGDGTYALMLEYLPVDWETGSDMVDTILDLSIVVAPQSEDDTPDFITDLMESISGNYEFDDYCVLIYPDYDREMYIANVYGDGFDLYFTFEAVDLGDGTYALMLEYLPVDWETGSDMVDTILDLSIVVAPQENVEPDPEEPVDYNYLLNGTYEFKPEEGVSFVVKFENGVIYVLEDTIGLGLSEYFFYTYNPMTGIIQTEEGWFYMDGELNLYYGGGWLLSPVAPVECEHEYEQNFFWHPELVAATCTETGVAVFECIYCDHYYTVVTDIDPEAHAFWGDVEIITEVNCATETNGLKKVYCVRCGAYDEQVIYYEDAHEMDVQISVEATCTEGGEYYAVCTLCGFEEHQVSEANGHNNYYLTCGETGACMQCGEEFTKEHDWYVSCTEPAVCMNWCGTEGAAAPGHTWVDPTCVDAGYCSVCYEEGEAATGEHTWVAPTCNEAGYCSVCEAEGEAATGEHTWVDPTCVDAGYCSVCNAEGEAATGEHTWVAPTCTADGYCSVCETEGEAALGHTAGAEATCTTAQICTVCEVELVAALGHNYNGTWEPMGNATYGRTCANDASHVETLATADLLAQFYALEKDTAYSGTVVLEGVISSIDEAYNTQYKNITVTIVVDGCTEYAIKCYRLKGDAAANLSVGDTIKVSGKIKNYSGTIEFDSGCTILNHVAHECEFAAATCIVPATCVICGTTTGDVIDHIYVDGECSGCGKPESLGEETTVTVSIKDYASANGWSNSVKYTSLVMDENITVTVSGGSNTGKYYTSGTNWRMYQNESPKITITAEEGKTILSVKISYASEKTGVLTLNGETIATNEVVSVNGSTVTFSVGNSSSSVTNGQARITAIEVVYA